MSKPTFPRSSGVLLHPSSLPGRYGIGDLGDWSYQFVNWLVEAKQSIWQVLPLGPTSYGDSPYQCLSAFAGNPNLISLDKLAQWGFLSADDLADVPNFPADNVDYGWIIPYHQEKLALAYSQFAAQANPDHHGAFAVWCAEQAWWLDDYALFIALKDANGGRPWPEWAQGEALRDPATLATALQIHATAIQQQKFIQWMFFSQWTSVKEYANSRGIRIVGDIPIFVAHDSADVWANSAFYYLEADGNPTVIAGVPPDYFSPTGQRWGNPLYRWDVMKADGYRWWIRRIAATLRLVDAVRIDHFRGFEAYWEVPASEETAIRGRWVPGPGADLFHAITAALGDQLPIIAEDLGVITDGVVAIRDGFHLPGMKVLQFAFGGSGGVNSFLPHHHVQNCVVYTGTHDNNTTVGWWNSEEASPDIKAYLPQYLGHEVGDVAWELIRMGMASVGNTFVVPMQDILSLGAESRMNTPGKQGGNWGWRFAPAALNHPAKERLAKLTEVFGRLP